MLSGKTLSDEQRAVLVALALMFALGFAVGLIFAVALGAM